MIQASKLTGTMDQWTLLIDILIVLTSAAILGALFERLKVGAVIGYIVAGIFVGPGALGWVTNREIITGLAELGISLLLFSTGLEFSILRLRKLGRGILFAGAFQLIFCGFFFTAIGLAYGFDLRASIAIAAAISVSSTAIVLRVLRDVGDLDANHGRTAFGILLIQDIALVPLVILVTLLGQGDAVRFTLSNLLPSIGAFVVGAAIFLLLITRVFPSLFRSRTITSNRELPVLLAIVTCAGSAAMAHHFGLSAALGAFIAGVLLAETSLETQIRADMASLRILFGTVFFVSIGMLADVGWIAKNWLLVSCATLVVLVGKTLMNFVAIRTFRHSTISSVAAAITLAQVGELSFILVQISTLGNVIPNSASQLITAVIVLTMMLSPFLIRTAPKFSRALALRILSTRKLATEESTERKQAFTKHFVVVGFGTAGLTATQVLTDAQYPLVAVDIHPGFAKRAREAGAIPVVGDATHIDLLEELHLNDALGLIVALPDARSAMLVIANARALAPELIIVARSRNRVFRNDLKDSGATLTISEEELLGQRLGEQAVLLAIGEPDSDLTDVSVSQR